MSNRSPAARRNPVARLSPIVAPLAPFLLALAAWQWGFLFWRLVVRYLGVPDFGFSSGSQDTIAPLLAMLNPLLVMAGIVALQKAGTLTRATACAAMLGTAVALSLTLWPEAHRLITGRGSLSVLAALNGADGNDKLTLFLTGLAIVTAWSLLAPDTRSAVTRPRRTHSDNYGHADWASLAAVRRRFPGPDPRYGGLVVGEAYRVDEDPTIREPNGTIRAFDPQDPSTWGRGGGTTPLLIDPCRSGSTHAIAFAGSGAFKTTGIAIPAMTTWTGSAVVLDPSREIGPMTAALREGMGHRVITLDPTQPGGDAFNVLAWIDPTDPLPEAKIETVVRWLGVETSPQQEGTSAGFFMDLGNSMLGAVIADTIWNPNVRPHNRTLKRVGALFAKPESFVRDHLRYIHAQSASPLARQLAGSLIDLADETFSGVYANAGRTTRWLLTPGFADLVSGDSFQPGELCGGQLTIFIQIPLHVMDATPALARVIIGALINTVYQADGKVDGRVLYLIDEAARLNRLSILETVRDAGRKYGITMVLLYQAVGQVIQQWGAPGKSAWDASTSWRSYAGVQDYATARELSDLCGAYGIETTSVSTGQGEGGASTRNETQGETRRRLIEPSEILQDLRADEQIIIRAGSRPIRCGRAIFFRRPAMAEAVGQNRFYQAPK